MANVVVVGAQWGDEGKGKIVDWLSEQADVVVRFQGGHNAGHTLVIDGVTYKLSLLPSGVVRGGTLSVIGNGVVVDPWHLVDEIARIGQQGVAITPENLRIADNATLILPLHRELDHFRETSNAVLKIGTTKRGIGPAYEDKVGRRAIRVVDLADAEMLDAKIGRLLAHHNALRRGLGIEEIAWSTNYPLWTVVIVLTWQFTPFMMLILLAGLSGQPKDVLEAATDRCRADRPDLVSVDDTGAHRMSCWNPAGIGDSTSARAAVSR